MKAEIKCILKHGTTNAWLIVQDGRERWLPKSLISYSRKNTINDERVLHIPVWLAEEKDLEYEEVG